MNFKLYNRFTKFNYSFSMIELSIALVIIALIMGVMTLSMGFVHNARMQRVMKDFVLYSGAINNFIERYNTIPGDMHNAETHFKCSGCNGSGNGLLNTSREELLAWNHLFLSKFVSDNYPDVQAGIYTVDDAKYYLPSGSINGSSYVIKTGNIDGKNKIFLEFGKITSVSATTITLGSVLNPADTMYMDTKLDDSVADTGILRGVGASCIDNAQDSKYNLSSSAINCHIRYIIN